MQLELSMISNGMLIDDKVAKRIKESGITLVAVSLDGMKAYHNDLRGNEKAYDKVMEAIHALKKQRVQVNVITTVMKDNLELLPEIENILAKEKIGFWQLQLGIPKKHFLTIDSFRKRILKEIVKAVSMGKHVVEDVQHLHLIQVVL